MVRTHWKVPKSWNTWFPPNKKQHQTPLLRSRSFKIGSNSPNSTPLKLNQWESESPGSVTHKSTRRRPWPIYDLIWFIIWNGNKSTKCYHYTRMNLTVGVFFRPLYLLFDVHERNFANYTTPKTTTLLGKPRILWKGSFSVSKKRGVISRFIKSLPFVCKLLLIYQDLLSSHLHIFISSHCPTSKQKSRAENKVFSPTSSPPLGVFCSPPPPTTLWYVLRPTKAGLPQRLWLH